MDYNQYKKRLKKCSFEAICMYLHSSYDSQKALRQIELIEYNIGSKKLINVKVECQKKAEGLDTNDMDQRLQWLKLHEEWMAADRKLQKLDKWFSARMEGK